MKTRVWIPGCWQRRWGWCWVGGDVIRHQEEDHMGPWEEEDELGLVLSWTKMNLRDQYGGGDVIAYRYVVMFESIRQYIFIKIWGKCKMAWKWQLIDSAETGRLRTRVSDLRSITSHSVCGRQAGCICSGGSDPGYDTLRQKLIPLHLVYCV